MPLLRINCLHNCESAPGFSILIYLSVLRPGPYLGDYCSFLSLKSDSVSPLFFFKIVLAVLNPLHFCINFRIKWLISIKTPGKNSEFLLGLNQHLYSTESSKSIYIISFAKQYICLHLFRYSISLSSVL